MTAPLTIQSIHTRAVDAPLIRPITTAVAAIPSAPLLLIDIRTTEGVVGHAYILGYTPMSLRPMAELMASLSDFLAGKPVAPLNRAAELADTFRLLGRPGLTGMVLSGLDMALWDALGKAHDVSVARLLGADEIPLPAYDSFGIVFSDRDVKAIADSVNHGFKAIKIKVGGGDLARDVEAVSRVREAIGPDIRLMIDYNQSLNVPEAIHRINRLAEFDLHWVEEPVPAEDITGHAKVRTAVPVPIQTGENWWHPNGAAQAIAAGASDHAMLDMMKIGGVSGWMRAAALAEAASLPVSSHSFIDASAHALAATPSMHYVEHLETTHAVMRDPLLPVDGTITPRGPGLGIYWNETAANKYAV